MAIEDDINSLKTCNISYLRSYSIFLIVCLSYSINEAVVLISRSSIKINACSWQCKDILSRSCNLFIQRKDQLIPFSTKVLILNLNNSSVRICQCWESVTPTSFICVIEYKVEILQTCNFTRNRINRNIDRRHWVVTIVNSYIECSLAVVLSVEALS